MSAKLMHDIRIMAPTSNLGSFIFRIEKWLDLPLGLSQNIWIGEVLDDYTAILLQG